MTKTYKRRVVVVKPTTSNTTHKRSQPSTINEKKWGQSKKQKILSYCVRSPKPAIHFPEELLGKRNPEHPENSH